MYVITNFNLIWDISQLYPIYSDDIIVITLKLGFASVSCNNNDIILVPGYNYNNICIYVYALEVKQYGSMPYCILCLSVAKKHFIWEYGLNSTEKSEPCCIVSHKFSARCYYCDSFPPRMTYIIRYTY